MPFFPYFFASRWLFFQNWHMNCPHWLLYLDLFAAREAEGDHHSSALCDPLGPTPLRFLVLFRSFVIVSPSDCFGLPCSLLSWGFPCGVFSLLPQGKADPFLFPWHYCDCYLFFSSPCPQQRLLYISFIFNSKNFGIHDDNMLKLVIVKIFFTPVEGCVLIG